jgi:uncharacterized membrane protein
MRKALADYYQAAAVFGIALVAWRMRRRRRDPHREYVFLAAASLGTLVAAVVLPDLSAEYGLLRAFQQGLFFFAPFIAEFTVTVAGLVTRALRRAWRDGLAFAGAMAGMASLIGLIPQVIGGYQPQLSLNNAGIYYNDYYLHPQEESSIGWVDSHLRGSASVQAEVQTDRYTFYLIDRAKARASADIYPTLISKDAYVYLGYSTVRSDVTSVSFDGNTISYRYPMWLLNRDKNLVFADPGSRIYR